MCPSYMATRDESATTRGRANTLRLAMSGQLGQDPMAALASDEVHEVLELCLACKACKSECPNAVDMAKLKSDALQMRHDRRGTPLGARLMGGMPDAAKRIAGPLAPLVNAVQSTPPFKWALQKLAGIDRRRPLPRFASSSLQRQLQRREPTHAAAGDAFRGATKRLARPAPALSSSTTPTPTTSSPASGSPPWTCSKRAGSTSRSRRPAVANARD